MKHTTLSRFASLAASAALALSLAACGSTSRSTYSAAVSNDTAALAARMPETMNITAPKAPKPGKAAAFLQTI